MEGRERSEKILKKMGRNFIRENGEDENRSEGLEKTERMKREREMEKRISTIATPLLLGCCSQNVHKKAVLQISLTRVLLLEYPQESNITPPPCNCKGYLGLSIEFSFQAGRIHY